LALVLVVAAAMPAAAEPTNGGASASVEVAILDEKGAPVFCTRNATDGHARPDAEGGYRVTGLRAGKWVVTLELLHERVDILVTAEEGEAVVVPPVIARGWCKSIALTRRLDLRRLVEPEQASWAVHYDRRYRSQRGQLATGYRFQGRLRPTGSPRYSPQVTSQPQSQR
jgi:hypothetical protein